MNNASGDQGVRQRLINAGLAELLEHGSADFSLRRVAAMAQVSCAAPYRHFKDKDDLVRAIISEIRENWILLTKEIHSALGADTRLYVVELAVAAVRFWVAGDNFAPFLTQGEIKDFDLPIISAVESYAKGAKLSDEATGSISTALLALVYGFVTLILSGRIDAEKAVKDLRKEVERLLDSDKL